MRQSTCNTSLVLRKGAWTVEEDMLLKNCIQKFGEGKWHLVPLRAGLNRCRKSCRLRWLNYLRPNIKKGAFGEDEVDLMLRIHRLIGNRWSLIAGRIPGRTANDVKNYWNTHVRSRPKQQKEESKDGEPSHHTMVTIIKPQPRIISKTFNLCPHIMTRDTRNLITSSSNDGINNRSNTNYTTLVSSPTVSNDKMNAYLDELFDGTEKEVDNGIGWSFGGFSNEGEGLDGQNSMFDLPVDDVVMWDLLESNQL